MLDYSCEPVQPLFQVKTFDTSGSDESSDDSSDESSDESVVETKNNLESASTRLTQQIEEAKSTIVLKKEAEWRRKEAARARQLRFEKQILAKPTGQKTRFVDSDDSDNDNEETGPKQLLESSDDEADFDISSKLRPEFQGQTGAKLFAMEKTFGDDRFKVDERFKDDAIASQVALANRKADVQRRKREFQNVRHMPTEDDSDGSDGDKVDITKNQFTNVRAPDISETTHYNVGSINIGSTEQPIDNTGFSLASMFNSVSEHVPVSEHGDETNESITPTRSHDPKSVMSVNTITLAPVEEKPKEKFNFFQTFDLTKYVVDKEQILKEREKAKEIASKDYQHLAKKAKRNRNSEYSSRIDRIVNWF